MAELTGLEKRLVHSRGMFGNVPFGSLIRKHDQFTPARKMRRDARAPLLDFCVVDGFAVSALQKYTHMYLTNKKTHLP